MTQRDTHQPAKLASLKDWKLEHSSQDLRGKALYSANGQEIGRVDDMLADTDEERIVALRLHDNRIVNIDHVDIRDGKAVLMTPDSSLPAARADFDRDNITRDHIPVVEESLAIGKREVELGKVRVRSHVVSERVSEDVPLTEEHVRVERRDMHEALTGAQADDLLRDDTIEVTETGERVVVSKTAAVTGEVVVGKEATTRTEHVEETVRHTEVDVDRDPAKR